MESPLITKIVESYNEKDISRLDALISREILRAPQDQILKKIRLYISFKKSDYANLSKVIDSNNIGMDNSTKELLRDYIAGNGYSKINQYAFKIKEFFLYFFGKNKKLILSKSLEHLARESINNLRRRKRLSFPDLYEEEIIEIARKNIKGTKASELVNEYYLKNKYIVYQAKRYFKRYLRDNDIYDGEILDKINRKSYRNLNKNEIISISRKNMLYKISAEELVYNYNLTNKNVVYKINKQMKNFFNGLEYLIFPEAKSNIIKMEDYKIA